MVTTTPLRILRHRHHITLKELQRCCGFSFQYINLLELGITKRTPRNERIINEAVQRIIADRKAALVLLEQEYQEYKGDLLQPLEVEADEL